MSVKMFLLIIFFVLLLILFAFLKFYHFYDKIPKGIRFVKENSSEKQFAIRIAKIYKDHPYPIVGIRQFGIKPCLIITDLNLIKLVLVNRFDCFQNRGLFYNASNPLSMILGTIDHDHWKAMKRKVAPAFTMARLKQIFPQLKSACDRLAENLINIDDSGERAINVVDAFSCMSDAIAAVAFGNHNNEVAGRLYQTVIKAKKPYLTCKISEIMDAFPDFCRSLGLNKYRRGVSDFIIDFVTETVRYRQESNVRMNDFMQSWIDAGLETQQIAAIASDLLSTGYADSTSTLAYCLYELALNEDIQDLARREIRMVLKNQDLSYERLQQMKYCNQIIKEAERKYPVGGLTMRVASKDFVVPDTEVTIPRGMKVFIPIYGIHHDENYYNDPETFNPDRFTEEAINARHRYAFLPFGAGPRQCIGYRLAEMIVGIGLVTLLKNFQFSTCSETRPIEFNRNKRTLHPKSGVTLNVSRI